MVNVSVPIGFGYYLTQHVFGFVEFTPVVVFAAEQQQLPDVVIHENPIVLEKAVFYHQCFELGNYLTACSVLTLPGRVETASPRG